MYRKYRLQATPKLPVNCRAVLSLSHIWTFIRHPAPVSLIVVHNLLPSSQKAFSILSLSLSHGRRQASATMKAKTHLYNLLPSSCNGYISESSSSSPPSSPRRPSRATHSRRRLRSKAYLQSRPEIFFAGILLRRNVRLFLLLPLFYISGVLMCVGSFSAVLRFRPPPLPGSVYRSPEVFRKLWPEIQSDNASAVEVGLSSSSFFSPLPSFICFSVFYAGIFTFFPVLEFWVWLRNWVILFLYCFVLSKI